MRMSGVQHNYVLKFKIEKNFISSQFLKGTSNTEYMQVKSVNSLTTGNVANSIPVIVIDKAQMPQ